MHKGICIVYIAIICLNYTYVYLQGALFQIPIFIYIKSKELSSLINNPIVVFASLIFFKTFLFVRIGVHFCDSLLVFLFCLTTHGLASSLLLTLESIP